MATLNVNDIMKTIDECKVQAHGVQKSDIYSHVNDAILDAILKYTSVRKLNEALWDVNDSLCNKIAEIGDELGLKYYFAWNRTVGSHGEGMGLLGNDVDRLCINRRQLTVVAEDGVQPSADELQIDSSNCYPGYCRMKFHRLNRQYLPVFEDEDQITKCGRDTYLKNSCISSQFLKSNATYFTWSRHGPAITNDLLGQDFVLALRIRDSRPLMTQYLSRDRIWPPQEVVEKLKTDIECSVVSAAHAWSKNPEIEYRLSFAEAEKFLIRQMNDIQFAVYCYLKQVKSVLESGVEEMELIRSYHIKTVLLWLCELTKPSEWTENNFLRNVVWCLEVLKRCFLVGHLPSLFVTENNLIGHLSEQERAIVHDKIAALVDGNNVALNAMRALCDDSFEKVYQRTNLFGGRHIGLYIQEAFKESNLSSFPLEHISLMMEVETLSHFSNVVFIKDTNVLCRSLIETIDQLPEILSEHQLEIQLTLRPMFHRVLGDCFHCLSRFSRQSYQIALESYNQGLDLTLPVNLINDRGVSGKTHLALFHYLNMEYDKAIQLIQSIETQLVETDIVAALFLCVTAQSKDRFATDDFLYGVVMEAHLSMPEPHGHAVIKYPAVALYIASNCYMKIGSGLQCHKKLNRYRRLCKSLLVEIESLSVQDTFIFETTLVVILRAMDIMDKLNH